MYDAEPTGEQEVPKLRGHELIDIYPLSRRNHLYLKESSTFQISSRIYGRKGGISCREGGRDFRAKRGFLRFPFKERISTSEDDENDDGQIGKEELDDSCFTETLAKIYIKQHRYDKALEIIKKLSLNYPKKNAYFADQIRFLEKLIINAKSK